MQNVWTQQADDIAQRSDEIANRFGTPTTPQGAGEVMREGARQRATERFETRQEALYNRAYSAIGAQARTTTPNTSRLLNQLFARDQAAGGSRDDTLSAL